jgi:PAS domain S-box-containing protein
MKHMRDRPFGLGALLGYLLALALVVGIGILAVVQLSQISTTVDELTNDLAVERGLAKDIVNQVLLTRLYAHRYVDTKSQSTVDRFDEEFSRLEALLALANEETTNPEREAMLARIDSAATAYDEAFEEVASLIRNTQRINAEILDIQEHVMLDKLTALRVHLGSVSVNNPSAFLAFGNAQKAMERMRSSTLKFLVERDVKYAVQFDVAYREAQVAFSNLEAALQDPTQRENATEAQIAARTYHEGMAEIRLDQAALSELLARMEEDLEPEISGVASDIATSIEEAFESRNASSQVLIAQARSVLMGTTAIAVVTGLGLGIAIAHRAAESRRAHEALRDSEQRYRTLFEGVPVGLYRSTPTGKLLNANPSMIEMLKCPSLEELQGTDVNELYVNPATKRRWQALMDDAGIVRSFEAQVRRYDDVVIWVRDSARAVQDEDGNLLHYEGSLEDITERKEAEAALQEAQEQLMRREKLAVLGQLAGGVAHELRNPLGVMSNAVYYLQLVLSDSDEVTEEYLGIISQEIQNAEKTISDLLDFTRIKSPARSFTAVKEVVDSVLLRSPAPSDVDVIIQLPPNLPDVFADPQQITQILTNLVTNAYQAMPEGGSITVRAATTREEVALSVTDTGTGMSPETMDRLFEPLFTTKAKGIGLGLATSRYLVESNEGRISVESAEGKGSTFTVFLPTATDTAP